MSGDRGMMKGIGNQRKLGIRVGGGRELGP